MKCNSGWEPILESAECCEVLERVTAERKKRNVYPSETDVFLAFEDCPFKKVRVVILGQDPYASKGQAIGRAFAVPESTKLPRSLQNIFKEVSREYPCREMPKETLESWAIQGVFLLNTTLTVEDGHFNSHAKIGWKKAVTIPTLKKLSAECDHLVFMLWGNHAKSFKGHILDQPRHLVLEASHPSPRRKANFQECGHFREANDYLSTHGIEQIIWTRWPA
ncbi:MAG: uracil-DNA glycosylase [Candidatus Sulfotelmatobacter sp.]|jgi:uracil-DNA glycosylase